MSQKLKSKQEWKSRLTSEQFHVTRERGTENEHSGKYTAHFEPGVYHCVCCENSLFQSGAKYEAGFGWPCFLDVIPQAIKTTIDMSHGFVRIEVMCSKCDAHLGHLFKDGPPPTGKRYCINSCSLEFKAADQRSDDSV